MNRASSSSTRRLKGWVAAAAMACAGSAAQAGSVDLPYQISGAYSVPITSLREARFKATVPQQYDFSCGSAALSTLLSFHYQDRVAEQQVFEEMYANGDQAKIQHEGFSLLDMKRYLEAHGYQADGFEATLDTLAETAIPAIALIVEGGYNHFVVIKGVRDGRVLIGDPAGGTRAMTRTVFEAAWANRILFVIGNRRELAIFNANGDWATAPRAPLRRGYAREGLSDFALPRLGPSDF